MKIASTWPPEIIACRLARLFCVALLLCGAMARRSVAVEVSLEDNKAAVGGVGYVDMQVLFKLFPETQRAKLSFEDAVHQTEEQVNLHRAEIMGLRAEISRLTAERDFAVKSSSGPIVSLASSDSAVVASSVTARTPEELGARARRGRGARTEPGAADEKQPAISVSSSAVASASVPSSVSASSATAAASPLAAKISELDRQIREESKLAETKEADLARFEDKAEKSLLDLESRKSEILLGQIYTAIQEVAKANNISVVVDKSQIIFGQKAVDLTDKVVQKLKNKNS